MCASEVCVGRSEGTGVSWLRVAMDLAWEDMQAQSTGTVPNTQDEWIVEVQEGCRQSPHP